MRTQKLYVQAQYGKVQRLSTVQIASTINNASLQSQL